MKREIKEYPILFSTPMVQAILEGRKTQTRRVVKFPLKCKTHHLSINDSDTPPPTEWNPYGQSGDVLWVKETFFAYGYWFRENKESRFEFRDITLDPILGVGAYNYMDSMPRIVLKRNPGSLGWYKRPSIFMPKAACRISLRITNVRVERLKDISEQDAKDEGAGKWKEFATFPELNKTIEHETHAAGFTKLWASINGEQSWNDNPWVWVIEFERVEKM